MRFFCSPFPSDDKVKALPRHLTYRTSLVELICPRCLCEKDGSLRSSDFIGFLPGIDPTSSDRSTSSRPSETSTRAGGRGAWPLARRTTRFTPAPRPPHTVRPALFVQGVRAGPVRSKPIQARLASDRTRQRKQPARFAQSPVLGLLFGGVQASRDCEGGRGGPTARGRASARSSWGGWGPGGKGAVLKRRAAASPEPRRPAESFDFV